MKYVGCMALFAIFLNSCGQLQPSDRREMATSASGGPGAGADATSQTKPSPNSPRDPNPTLANQLTVSYQEDLSARLLSTCTASCHSLENPSGSILLDSYDALRLNAARAIDSIKQGRMPPVSTSRPTAERKQALSRTITLLERWQDDGFLSSYKDLKVSYSQDLAPLAQAACLACHSLPGSPAALAIDLSSFANWRSGFEAIQSAVKTRRMPPGINAEESQRFLSILEQWELANFPLSSE